MPPPCTSAYERKVTPGRRVASRDLRSKVLKQNHDNKSSPQQRNDLPPPPEAEPEDMASHELSETSRPRLIELFGIGLCGLEHLNTLSFDSDSDEESSPDLDITVELSEESDAASMADPGEMARLSLDSPAPGSEARSNASSDSDEDVGSDMTGSSSVGSAGSVERTDSIRSFNIQILNDYVVITSKGPPERGMLFRRPKLDNDLASCQLCRYRIRLFEGKPEIPAYHRFTLRPVPKVEVLKDTLSHRDRFASRHPSPLRTTVTMEDWGLRSTGDLFLDTVMWLENGQPGMTLTNWNTW